MIVNGDEFENIELRQPQQPVGGPGSHCHWSSTAVVLSVAGTPAAGAPAAVKRDVDNNISSDPPPPPPPRAPPTLESAVVGVARSTDADRQRDSSSGYASESGDMLRELVKNKEQIELPHRKQPPVKMGSADSEVSDTSNLASRLPLCFPVSSHVVSE